jgi:hypothetical protein
MEYVYLGDRSTDDQLKRNYARLSVVPMENASVEKTAPCWSNSRRTKNGSPWQVVKEGLTSTPGSNTAQTISLQFFLLNSISKR